MVDLIISILVTTILGVILGTFKLVLFKGNEIKRALKVSLIVCCVIDLLLIFIYLKWGVSFKSFVWQN